MPLYLLKLLLALDLLLHFVIAQTDQVGFGGIQMGVTQPLGVTLIPPHPRREGLEDQIRGTFVLWAVQV